MAHKTKAHLRQTAITRAAVTLPAPHHPPATTPANKPASVASKIPTLWETASAEVLAVTYWFEPEPQPRPYAVTIKFVGQRLDVEGPSQFADQFVHYETVDEVISGSGSVAVTVRIRDIHPGKWAVTARIQPSAGAARKTKHEPVDGHVAPAQASPQPIARFWRRWMPPTVGSAERTPPPAHTCLTPFVRAPGVLPGAWITFVIVGIVLALVLQSLVIRRDHLAFGSVGFINAVALVAGIAGAKVWYLVKHWRARDWKGWCVQGFVTGTSLAVVALLLTHHMPLSAFLDATAPGMFTGMAVGRIGCFFAGCCGGPPTASRWGIWSSDQRVGMRRVPTQLLEVAFTLSLGLATLIAVLRHGPLNGAFFIAAIAAYVLGRQGVLRLRAEAHPKGQREMITTALAALALVTAFAIVIVHVRVVG